MPWRVHPCTGAGRAASAECRDEPADGRPHCLTNAQPHRQPHPRTDCSTDGCADLPTDGVADVPALGSAVGNTDGHADDARTIAQPFGCADRDAVGFADHSADVKAIRHADAHANSRS